MWFFIPKKNLILFLVLVCLFFFIFGIANILNNQTNVTTTLTTSYIAIIIDDFGNYGDGTEALLNLDIPITAAIMPFLLHSRSDALMAQNAGKEIILHIPMEPVHGKAHWLGPFSITSDLSEAETKSRIYKALEEIEWAQGMNNHMGSKIMQDNRLLSAVVQVAKEKKLYFVDSKTTPDSVASEICMSLNVPFFARDVFLDNSKNKRDIVKQLYQLAEVAKEKGYAIGIGHVGPEGGTVTAQAIASVYQDLESKGIKFVFVSQLKELY